MNRGHAQSVMLIVLAVLALVAVAGVTPHAQSNPELALKAAMDKEVVDGDLKAAIELYRKVAASGDRSVAARALVRMGQCYEKLGEAQVKEARATYERVVLEFGDQAEAAKVARARLSALTRAAGGATGQTEAATRRVWLAGSEQPVAVSPDGRYVVFFASDVRDLWLRDLQSGERTPITREAAAISPFATGKAVISPDGKRIAYEWFVGNNLEIRVSALDGSSVQVADRGLNGRIIGLCAWMPDGRRLLTGSLDPKDRRCQRHIILLADGSIRDVGQPETGYVDWAYPSPDGRHIAYDLRGDIFVYDTTTGQDSVLVQNPAADDVVGWTPDGSGIVFVSNRSGTSNLYLLGIEKGRAFGDPQLLRRNIGSAGALRITRDGRLFRFEDTSTSNSFIVSVDEKTGKLTGSPSPVDPNYPEAAWPGWSPDGKLLYYQVLKGPSNDRSLVLFIRAEATAETREITPKPKLMNWGNPVLSPDGRRFVFSGIDQNRTIGVYTIDSASGDVSLFAKMPFPEVNPVPNWALDGNSLFYNVRLADKIQGKGIATRRRDLATGDETNFPGHHIDMKISPDGTRLVYVQTHGATKSWLLGVLDVQSGTELELWRVPEAEAPDIKTPAWTPDGKYVLVARDLKQGSDLWRFPAAGGPGEKLHVFADRTWGFVLHPSGKRMAFTQERRNYELWVLENFLPAAKAPAR